MSKPICADRGCKDKAHGHSFNFKSKGDLDKYRASKREVAGKMGKKKHSDRSSLDLFQIGYDNRPGAKGKKYYKGE